jgi:hypothetical protein
MITIKREYPVGDVKKLVDQMQFEEGIKNFRFLKKGKSLITTMKMVEFRSEIDFDKPLLYVSPIVIHDAPFVVHSDRIIVRAENEAKGNALIDVFISKHRL